MLLQVSFMPLLAGIFVGLSSTHGPVNAFSLSVRENKGLFTLPLKQHSQSRSVHPQIQLQQHLDRSRRRLARMTGRGAASTGELEDDLKRRDLPVGVTPAEYPTVKDSLGLDIEGLEVAYLATVQMGTPPQDFLLLIDSGSADLWVGAENCHSEDGGNCGNHNFLGSQSSSTFVDTGKRFSIGYGTGNLSGNVVTDSINIAGLPLNAHTLGVATMESVEFSSNTTAFDGIMGLAPSTFSAQKTLTPIEALAKQGLVKDAVVSYKLSRLADNKNDGEITFGGVDVKKFDPATLVSLPNVNQQGFWEAAMGDVSVNGQSLKLFGRTAILDTGTTLLIAPSSDAQAIHAAIPGSKSNGQGGFTVPCTTTAQVALTFGGTSFAIDSRDIAFAPIDPNNPTGDCVSGIGTVNFLAEHQWLAGSVFLRNAYFSTNVRKNQISLAKLL